LWRSGLNPEFVPYIATVKALAGIAIMRIPKSMTRMKLL
jgi:hypothetical protein